MDNHLLAKSMRDEELEDLSSAIYKEQTRRLEAQILAGEFAKANDVEKKHIRENNVILAIKSYRERTGSTLRLAKSVIEQEKESINGNELGPKNNSVDKEEFN